MNQYCRCDPHAVHTVFEFRHSINNDLKGTDVIARDEGHGVETISALGLLNSCLEIPWRIGLNCDETDPEPFRVVNA